jgi:WD40 repeat protein
MSARGALSICCEEVCLLSLVSYLFPLLSLVSWLLLDSPLLALPFPAPARVLAQGTKLITASSDKTCHIWSTETGECLQILEVLPLHAQHAIAHKRPHASTCAGLCRHGPWEAV